LSPTRLVLFLTERRKRAGDLGMTRNKNFPLQMAKPLPQRSVQETALKRSAGEQHCSAEITPMKNQPLIRYTAREWMRALGFSALCGVGAIAVWFLVMLTTRDMSQAASAAVKVSVWLLPAVVAIFSPVLLFTHRHGVASAERGG
jgi:hypothetical protein